jgi:hypothetical protein
MGILARRQSQTKPPAFVGSSATRSSFRNVSIFARTNYNSQPGSCPNLLRRRRRSQVRHHLSSGSNWAGSTASPFRVRPRSRSHSHRGPVRRVQGPPPPYALSRKRPEVDKDAIHMSKSIRSTASAAGLRSAVRQLSSFRELSTITRLAQNLNL